MEFAYVVDWNERFAFAIQIRRDDDLLLHKRQCGSGDFASIYRNEFRIAIGVVKSRRPKRERGFYLSWKDGVVQVWVKLSQAFAYDFIFGDLRVNHQPLVPEAYYEIFVNNHIATF